MVRVAKSKGRKNKNQNQVAVNSDNENDENYSGGFDSRNPFEGDDIEQFHSKNDKILLNKIGGNKKKSSTFDYSSNEEEALAFDDTSDSDDDDDMDDKVYGSDVEEEDLEDDEQDGNDDDEDDYGNSNWGQRKSAYYSGNKIDNEEDALLEEEEAKALQARMMKQLDTNDFGLDAFKIDHKAMKTSDDLKSDKVANKALGDGDELDQETLKKISKNLSIMSKKEKLDFLQRESPELFELIRDFKIKLEELEETLLPIFKLIKSGQIPHSSASEFIVNKTKLYLTYCCHLSFYFVLKTQRVPIENHPIVKNILQFRNLTKQISSVSEKLEDEIQFIKSQIKDNKQLNFMKPSKITAKRVNFKTRNIQDGLQSDNSDVNASDDEVAEGVEKRAINYQISKNKGLTPKRNKMYRNPRVKYRIKARSANVKRKSIVPKVRSQETKYSGESTGIRTSVIRSAKFR